MGQGAASELLLSPALQRCVQHFTEFYTSQHSGRKLDWLQHLSTADVKAQLGKRSYEFCVSTYQLAILLLFNDADSLSAADVHKGTLLNEKELDRNIRSLVAARLLRATTPLTDAPIGPCRQGRACV